MAIMVSPCDIHDPSVLSFSRRLPRKGSLEPLVDVPTPRFGFKLILGTNSRGLQEEDEAGKARRVQGEPF